MVRGAFRRTLAAAPGIPEEKQSKLRLHDLRHTAASLMINAGQNLYAVGKVLGHSTPQTTARYSHLAPEIQRAAIDALEGALSLYDGTDIVVEAEEG